VLRNVFSEDGRVLLIERGSHLDGEYRIASADPARCASRCSGQRIRTPNAVTVDIESPGTGALGESGIDGYVDNRWGERIGAAMLLSLIDDAVKFVIQKAGQRDRSRHGALSVDGREHQQARREGPRQHDQHPAADLPEPGRDRRHLRRPGRRLLVGLRAAGDVEMSTMTDLLDDFAADSDSWAGDSTSVVEFLRPLRRLLDLPGVLEVCVNRPNEILVETIRGWQILQSELLSEERCLSLATAVATYSDQQINQERPLLAATLPSGERVQFVIPPAVTRGTVSITIRKPSELIRGLDDFEREGLFERTTIVSRTADSKLLPFEHELADLKHRGRYAEFLRLAVQKHQTIVVSGKTGSGKTTFMKGLVEEVPRHERLITIEDTAELTLPNHPTSSTCTTARTHRDCQGHGQVAARRRASG
jgi:type IV secretory pathway ATPase VirB11/archaellum biosynthesis ATPase